MDILLGLLAFAVWLLAVVSCTELGWRIPVVRDLLLIAAIERKDMP